MLRYASRPARESFAERLDLPKEMLRAIDADFSQLVSFKLGHSACLRKLSDCLLHLLVVFVVAVAERIDVDDFPVFKANLLHQLVRA